MILFELRCAHDHHFEAWFRDGAAYYYQAAAGAIGCPVCGDTQVEKALMAPSLAKRSGKALDAHEAAGEVRRMLGELKRKIQQDCDYVGGGFTEEARKIHYGETEKRAIYGEATADQARELQEEGIDFGLVPWVDGEN